MADATAQPDPSATPVTAADATPTPAPTATQALPPTPAIPILYDSNSDREALIALYESTRGQRWTNNTNWLSSQPLANWYGIQTNAAGRVTEVNLKKNSLRGPFPRELGRLEFLEVLDLSENGIRGSIPTSLGGLKRLSFLSLAWNNLSGSIPISFGNLDGLAVLTLNCNELSMQIPPSLGNILFETVHLYGYCSDRGYYHYNTFSGCVPDGLQDVADRKIPNPDDFSAGSRLYLPYCDPVANFGSSESDRQALIDLYHRTGGENWKHNTNWLTDAPLSDWYGVRVDANGRVIELTLAQNGLAGQIPETIDTLSQLGVLDLAGNALTGNIPGTIGGLVNLGSLLLQNNQLTGTIPTEVAQLPGLILDVVGNLLE